MADAVLENVSFGHNSAAGCLIFAKFCVKMQNLLVMTVDCEIFKLLNIQDGGRSPS